MNFHTRFPVLKLDKMINVRLNDHRQSENFHYFNISFNEL